MSNALSAVSPMHRLVYPSVTNPLRITQVHHLDSTYPEDKTKLTHHRASFETNEKGLQNLDTAVHTLMAHNMPFAYLPATQPQGLYQLRTSLAQKHYPVTTVNPSIRKSLS